MIHKNLETEKMFTDPVYCSLLFGAVLQTICTVFVNY